MVAVYWPKNKQTARYFSSKDGFIWDQERIEIQGLQPWLAKHKSLTGQGFYREEKEFGKAIVNKESMALLWLSLCQEEEEVFFFLLGSAITTGRDSSPFWFPNSIECRFLFINVLWNQLQLRKAAADPICSMPDGIAFLYVLWVTKFYVPGSQNGGWVGALGAQNYRFECSQAAKFSP